MKYVLLLRGINVGGKHKVKMTDLKELLEAVHLENVTSYINSGNLFFESDDLYQDIKEKITQILVGNYAFDIPFALVSADDVLDDWNHLPSWWEDDFARKDVLFFSEYLNREKIVKFIDSFELFNEAVYCGEVAVYWGKYDEKEYLKTVYHKRLIKEPFYKTITIRNGKTYNEIIKRLKSDK